ncbi:MAG: response regulator [Phycisphaerales bacterium]|nr:response regulator [Phycisphaerales bacterium]
MPGSLQNRRILVVDDDEDIRAGIVLALQADGASVTEAADGNEAVDLLAGDTPEAVVLDLMLPGRSGFLVLEEAQGCTPRPIVIMVTANEGRRHESWARTQGVDDYFVKPVPLGRLSDRLAQLLGEPS